MRRIFLAGDFALQSYGAPLPGERRGVSPPWKQPNTSGLRLDARLWIGLLLFGLSFGYIEAAVVVYLRGYYEPLHQQLYPTRQAGDLLPLIPLENWHTLGLSANDWTATELCREAATLLLLVGAALLVAHNVRQWLAAFVFLFGLWDLCYYLFLWLLIGWPNSLLAWDILFLLPVPWVAPVLAPALVALTMVAAGVGVLWRENYGQPFQTNVLFWLMTIVGGVIIWLSFCWDWYRIQAGGTPDAFPWLVFGAGWGIAVVGFGMAWVRSDSTAERPCRGPSRNAATRGSGR